MNTSPKKVCSLSSKYVMQSATRVIITIKKTISYRLGPSNAVIAV
jgi:hypothetical protein